MSDRYWNSERQEWVYPRDAYDAVMGKLSHIRELLDGGDLYESEKKEVILELEGIAATLRLSPSEREAIKKALRTI